MKHQVSSISGSRDKVKLAIFLAFDRCAQPLEGAPFWNWCQWLLNHIWVFIWTPLFEIQKFCFFTFSYYLYCNKLRTSKMYNSQTPTVNNKCLIIIKNIPTCLNSLKGAQNKSTWDIVSQNEWRFNDNMTLMDLSHHDVFCPCSWDFRQQRSILFCQPKTKLELESAPLTDFRLYVFQCNIATWKLIAYNLSTAITQ